MSIIKYALQYADAGLTVFPCNHEPGQWAKRPQIKEWKRNATTNPDQVKRWWTHWPNALIGWALPPHLVVIDTDPRNGGTETELAALCGGTTPDTLKVLSGGPDGSVHYYFIPPHTGLAQREVMPGIDSRIGGKGYVIAPPSPHPDTGTPYTWVNEGVPRQVVGRISLVLNVGVVGSARPRCTSLGRFHEMASWGRSSLYSIR